MHYPFLPVRALLRDRYPVLDTISRVDVPTVVVLFRATAAAQLGDLIWDTRTEGASELVTVSRDALVLVLQVVEAGLLNLDMDPDLAQFQAALTNLQTAMATPDNDANGEAK